MVKSSINILDVDLQMSNTILFSQAAGGSSVLFGFSMLDGFGSPACLHGR